MINRNSVNTPRHGDPCRAFATVAPAASNTSHWAALVAADTATYGTSVFPGGPSTRSQEPSLQAIRDLCRQRKLSHSGAAHKSNSAAPAESTPGLIPRSNTFQLNFRDGSSAARLEYEEDEEAEEDFAGEFTTSSQLEK